MAELQLPKLVARVRFPSLAPLLFSGRFLLVAAGEVTLGDNDFAPLAQNGN
jgi:hypothetical protein